jgi:hypothetical protein
VRLEGLGQMKYPVISQELKLVAKCLKKVLYGGAFLMCPVAVCDVMSLRKPYCSYSVYFYVNYHKFHCPI